jgi:ribosomal protein L9
MLINTSVVKGSFAILSVTTLQQGRGYGSLQDKNINSAICKQHLDVYLPSIVAYSIVKLGKDSIGMCNHPVLFKLSA